MSCSLQCTNKTAQSTKVCIPRGQCFKADTPKCQNMACIEDTVCTVPPGQTVTVPLSTMCVSPKSIKPPPASGVQYSLMEADTSERKLTDRLLTAATVLDQDHYYDALPPGDGIRPKTISQLAHWIDQGNASSNPADRVSMESLRNEIIPEKKYESLPKSQRKVMDKMCSQIYQASNSTLTELPF